MWQLLQNYHKCVIKTIMLQLCHMSTFPPPIMGYVCNYFSIMIPSDMISMAISVPLLKYYYSTML